MGPLCEVRARNRAEAANRLQKALAIEPARVERGGIRTDDGRDGHVAWYLGDLVNDSNKVNVPAEPRAVKATFASRWRTLLNGMATRPPARSGKSPSRLRSRQGWASMLGGGRRPWVRVALM